MAGFLPESKTVTLSSGHDYMYLYRPPKDSHPILLLLHGFPSTAYDFRRQTDYFTSRGYGVLAPDLLGYGGTSQPLDVQSYSMTRMAAEIVDILDHEGVGAVIGVGHDWGSALLSTLPRQYSDRFEAFAFLASYYTPAHPYGDKSGEYDYYKLRDETMPKFGFDAFGHTVFLGQAERAGKLLDEHVGSFFDLVWARDQGLWREFRREGGIEGWVGEDRRVGEVAEWVGGEEERERVKELWKMGRGFTPKCMWYKQLLESVSLRDEKANGDHPRSKLSQPILLMIEQKDVLGRGDSAEEMARSASENVYVEKCDTHHFIMLEDPEGTNRKLEKFFTQSSERKRQA